MVQIVTAVVYRSDGGQYGRRSDAHSLAQLRYLGHVDVSEEIAASVVRVN